MPVASQEENNREPNRGFKSRLGTSKIVSYEDLLIAQYIDDIKRAPDVGNKPGGSPYLGKYQSLEEGLSRQGMTQRPMSSKRERPVSAHVTTNKKKTADTNNTNRHYRPYSAAPAYQKPKIDAKFIADPDLWDPATPRDDIILIKRSQSMRSRPQSAPNRPSSSKKVYSNMIDHEIYLSKRPKKKKPLYKRQPYIIRCIAYKNGDRDIYSQLAAPNVKQLLEACTSKLQLNGAARRIFLEDGTEIFETDEIPRDGEIYVSNGEPFKNPYKSIIEIHEQKEQLKWTLSGVTLPQKETSKKKSKFNLSKRFQKLIAVNNRRVMVYLNGQHTNCHEVITNMKSTDDFLSDVTNKLALRSHARIIYDWNGKEITSLDQIPVMDSCLQEVGTPVLGPVWISCGGGFSPTGACKFLEDILSHLKKRVKEAKHYKSQLTYMQNGKKEKVGMASILSMTDEEVEDNLSLVDSDLEKMSETTNKMKEIHERVSQEAKDEQDSGYSYTLQHIKELDSSDSAVGGFGLKLKVYRNGQYGTPAIVYFNKRQASRGIQDSKLIFERLLDQCAAHVASSSQGTKFARRLFDINGDEISDLHELKTDQEVFLSMGESFKLPYVPCLQVYFEQIKGVEMQYPAESPMKQIAVFHQNAAYLETKKNDYEGVIGFPADYKWELCTEEMTPEIREEIMQSKQLDINTHWLIHKEKRDIMLNPALVISDKKKKGSNVLWPSDVQQWVLSKDGYIASRSMPFMVMSVLDIQVECSVRTKLATRVSGFAVGMQKKQNGNPAQQWRFTTTGLIYSVNQPELFLTFLGARVDESEDLMIKNEVEGIPDGFTPFLAVCQKISGKDSDLQRFGLKQERFDSLGQWKLNDHNLVTNLEFTKLAYSWPIDANQEWNDRFHWPMEFFFIAKAPSIRQSKKEAFGHIPLRLLVMKNGESDSIHCSPVVGPDLTNMMKDLSKQNEKSNHNSHHHSHHHHHHQHSSHSSRKSNKTKGDQDDSVSDFPLHCDDLTFRELEFRLFLERCTGALNLPFAARRLFDDEGQEHYTLKDLNRDQLVYATCGESWINPRISKAESQRRYLLTNLASDITQITQFCALRDTEGYVMEVEGAAIANAKLVVNHCPEMQEKLESEMEEQELQQQQLDKDEGADHIEADLLLANTTAHERSHQKLDDKEDKLKWPWERLANDELADIQQSPRRSPSPSRAKNNKATRNLQKFVYDEGFISCHSEPNLVIGVVSNSEGKSAEVALVKRKNDDLSQIWIFKQNGYIQSRSHRDMVLTVAMPTNQQRDEGLTLNYVGCQIVLQKKKSAQFGSANQKWYFDKETCFLYAFHTNHLDVEITSANKSNVCTYAVTKDELDQPGYIASLPSKNNKPREVVICTSCARSMRGRFKLTKLPQSYDFSCAMGATKHKELKNIGSFHCLNGKVDLSTFEAINTLDEWETKYNKLREESSVRTIAKEISAAEQPRTVKVYAYKNGEGRQKEGQFIVGSSIIGMLDQCTYRLGMTNAARRLYTRDGTVILDMDDLIGWAVDHYMANLQQKQKSEQGLETDGRLEPVGGHNAELESQDSVDAIQYQTFTIKTDANGDSYQPVNEEPIELQHALLEVTPGCNSHIALVYSESLGSEVVYEIILGRTSESAIIIHPSSNDDKQTGDLDELDVSRFPAIPMTEDTAERYWLSWSDSSIRVGRGLQQGLHVIMSKSDLNPRLINTIVVASPGADTTWTFHLPIVGSTVNSNASGPTDLHKLMDKVELNDDDEDTGSKKEEPVQGVELAKRIQRPKTAVSSKVEPPPLETILRYPIEVWASTGEAFVKPEKVATDQKDMKHYRKIVSDISYELEKEKHKLRQLQGRRIMEQNPGRYEATASSVVPVIKRNHWQEPSYDETVTHNGVHQLENQQAAIRARQRLQSFRPRVGSRLYTQPAMKRVLAFTNGESISRAQYVWGSNMLQILQNSTTRLDLRKAAKYIFDLNGQQLKYEDLEKDQIVCISTGNQFQRPKDVQQDVEIRAKWTRARKQNGPEATNITVHAHLKRDIDVDPFGPPSLASRSDRGQYNGV